MSPLATQNVPLGLLERYRIVAPLGKGGMAEVFLAAWEVAQHVQRPVVIKRLYTHMGDDPALVQMFIDEARLACGLEHENIVKTIEVGVIDDDARMSFELNDEAFAVCRREMDGHACSHPPSRERHVLPAGGCGVDVVDEPELGGDRRAAEEVVPGRLTRGSRSGDGLGLAKCGSETIALCHLPLPLTGRPRRNANRTPVLQTFTCTQ